MTLLPPVLEQQRKAQLDDSLKVSCVTRNKYEIVTNRNTRDERIGATDRLTRLFEFAVDASSEYRRLTVQRKNFFA